MIYEFGKLEKIEDLRTVWPHEEKNFTKWLIQDDNLELLGEAIGIDIELEERESSIGNFSADIYAKEENTNKGIIIENQLEDSNHDHLGKIITYASGKDASFIIWIVKRARDEHRKAIEWLNSHTDEEIGFFLIEIELWKIDNSKIAPKFNVVEKPNNWAKELRLSENLSELRNLQLNFWNLFKEYASSCKDFMTIFKLRKVFPTSYYDLSSGMSQCKIALSTNSIKKFITVGIYIRTADDKENVSNLLINNVQKLENILKDKVHIRSDKKDHRVFLLKNIDIYEKEYWNGCFKWYCDNAIVFYDIITKIKTNDF